MRVQLLFALTALACNAETAVIAKAGDSVALTHDFSSNPVPRFHGGAVVAWERESPRLHVWDRSGRTLVDRDLTIADGTLMIRDAAVDKGGAIAASGTLTSNQGRSLRESRG